MEDVFQSRYFKASLKGNLKSLKGKASSKYLKK